MEAAGLGLMLLEIVWAATWYHALAMQPLNRWVVITMLGSVMIISHYIARGLNYRRWQMGLRRLFFAFWVLICIILSSRILIHPDQPSTLVQTFVFPFISIVTPVTNLNYFWHVLAILVLVWRGVTLTHNPIGPISILLSFQLGLMMLLIYGLLNSLAESAEGLIILYAYLFISLVTLGISRIAGLTFLRGGKLPSFGTFWLMGIFISAMIIVAIAGFLGWSTAGKFTEIIAGFYFIISTIMAALGFILFAPVITAFLWLLPFLKDILMNILNSLNFPNLQTLLSQLLNQENRVLAWLNTVVRSSRSLTVWLILFLIFTAVLVSLRWKTWKYRLTREEEPGEIPDPLRASLLKGVRIGRKQSLFNMARRTMAAARIRQIYSQLLDLCSQLGHPRPKPATPLEFQSEIQVLFPAETSELETITQAYLRVRYGRFPETPEKIKEVLSAWDRLRSRARADLRIYRKQKKNRQSLIKPS